jgi:hypothetical protein
MKSKIVFASLLATLLASPLEANAQGIPDGIQHGASVGSQTAGQIALSISTSQKIARVRFGDFQRRLDKFSRSLALDDGLSVFPPSSHF